MWSVSCNFQDLRSRCGPALLTRLSFRAQALCDMSDHARTVEQALEGGFVLGRARSVESLNGTILDIARTQIPVLILGESGTGKDVYAKLVHRLSGSADAPLKRVNCSLLEPPQLLHQLQSDPRGSSDGHLSPAVLLDGIDELGPACQRVLLSLLMEREDQKENTDRVIRLISTSSRDLEADVKKGHFRKELYFRINGVCLRLPPLHERKEDLSALLEHFLKIHALDLNKTAPKLSPESLEILAAYDWPGNIRELENLARKMVALGNAESALDDIRIHRTERTGSGKLEMSFSLKTAVRAASREKERELILEALERTKWNRKRAARELQISYKALLYKLKQIG